jgi:diacylglycerol kinase
MGTLLNIAIFIAAYLALEWFAGKIESWVARDPDKAVESNGRVKDLAFFAAVGLAMTAGQMLMWAVQGITWAVHYFA